MTLLAADRTFLETARRATLATISPAGRPRLVPICFVVIGEVLWTPIDEKSKAVDDPLRLARVRDITARPEVTLLVDRWSEDWAELAWLRLEGRAAVVASRPSVVAALRAKYPQYVRHDLEARPLVQIAIERVTRWSASPAEGDATGRTVK